MGKRTTPERWLENDQAQLRWVSEHLEKDRPPHKRGIEAGPCDRESVLARLDMATKKKGGVEYFKGMRAAWSTHKFNLKSGKQVFSYSLRREIEAKLNRDAKAENLTKSDYLEKLIERGLRSPTERVLPRETEISSSSQPKPRTLLNEVPKSRTKIEPNLDNNEV